MDPFPEMVTIFVFRVICHKEELPQGKKTGRSPYKPTVQASLTE